MAGCASLKIGTDEKAKGLENTRKLGVEINGALNGMFITSTNENNPTIPRVRQKLFLQVAQKSSSLGETGKIDQEREYLFQWIIEIIIKSPKFVI